jgi:hypothetical protein
MSDWNLPNRGQSRNAQLTSGHEREVLDLSAKIMVAARAGRAARRVGRVKSA